MNVGMLLWKQLNGQNYQQWEVDTDITWWDYSALEWIMDMLSY